MKILKFEELFASTFCNRPIESGTYKYIVTAYILKPAKFLVLHYVQV